MTPVTQATRRPTTTYVVHGHEGGKPVTVTVRADSISRAQDVSGLRGSVKVHSGTCTADEAVAR